MESLLRWSIENSTPQDNAPTDHPIERKDLDPAIIDMILGKPDAELMKEDMAIATDVKRSEEERIDALDHLEMLIEQIDNANNLEKLKMWDPLQNLLTSDNVTTPIKVQTLWVVGTAVQNNPAAQDAYLSHKPLSTLTSFLAQSPSSTPQARSKAIYALSGLLKHNAPAVEALSDPEVDGWTKLRDALQDPDITVRRKTVFLLNTLLIPTTSTASESSSSLHTPDQQPIHPNSHALNLTNPSRTSTSPFALQALDSHKLLDTVIEGIINPYPYGEDGESEEADADFEEKSVRLLHTYAVTCNGEFTASKKQSLKAWIEKEAVNESGGKAALAEKWGLSGGELESLIARV